MTGDGSVSVEIRISKTSRAVYRTERGVVIIPAVLTLNDTELSLAFGLVPPKAPFSSRLTNSLRIKLYYREAKLRSCEVKSEESVSTETFWNAQRRDLGKNESGVLVRKERIRLQGFEPRFQVPETCARSTEL